MSVARSGDDAAAAGNLIYVVGGVDSSNKALSSAEKLDHAGVVVGRGPDDFKARRGTCRLARYVFFMPLAVDGVEATVTRSETRCVYLLVERSTLRA